MWAHILPLQLYIPEFKFQWMVGVSIWLGCLSASRTVSFCFSFGHIARYAPSCNKKHPAR